MPPKSKPASADSQLASADPDQVKMMEERVIVTDYYDNAIGHDSEKDCE